MNNKSLQLQGIKHIIDWPRLEEILIKKIHHCVYFKNNYQILLRHYILNLLQFEELPNLSFKISFDKNLPYTNIKLDNSQLNSQDVREFKSFLEIHQLIDPLKDDLCAQLLLWQDILEAKNEQEYLFKKILTPEINLENLMYIFKRSTHRNLQDGNTKQYYDNEPISI